MVRLLKLGMQVVLEELVEVLSTSLPTLLLFLVLQVFRVMVELELLVNLLLMQVVEEVELVELLN